MNWRHRAFRCGVFWFALGVGVAGSATPAESTPAELTQRIVAHGPWPVPLTRDPANRASGNPVALEFGYRMFREPRFSTNGYIACISCHQTDRAFTDAIARAQGLAPVGRNTPTLANLRLLRWYGWDGASDSLWMASLRPLLDTREFGGDAARVAHVVRIGDGHACRYRRSFGAAPTAHDDLIVMVNVAKAIAAFVETLTTGRTTFDDFRDALARGDAAAAANYPAAARRGAELFVGKGQCAACHAGANFSDGGFHHTGPVRARPGRAVDAGREAGIAQWRLSPFNRFGRFSEGRTGAPRGEPAGLGDTALRGQFRTPSLRNVAVTPPFMHDGGVDTLADAAAHHTLSLLTGSVDAGADVPQTEPLLPQEIRDLVAFLETLTDALGAARQFPALQRPTCP